MKRFTLLVFFVLLCFPTFLALGGNYNKIQDPEIARKPVQLFFDNLEGYFSFKDTYSVERISKTHPNAPLILFMVKKGYFNIISEDDYDYNLIQNENVKEIKHNALFQIPYYKWANLIVDKIILPERKTLGFSNIFVTYKVEMLPWFKEVPKELWPEDVVNTLKNEGEYVGCIIQKFDSFELIGKNQVFNLNFPDNYIDLYGNWIATACGDNML
jgi:hypothetical protein